MTDYSKKLLHGQEIGRSDSTRGDPIQTSQTKTIIIGNPITGTKKPAEKTLTHDPNKPESYVLSEQPIPSVMDFFDAFDDFEKKYDQFSGILYTLVASILIGILISIREEILYRLPAIEVIFSVIIVCLLLNYFLLNGALYKPFIENEENSLRAKACGFMAILVVIFFYYSMNSLNFYPATMLLYLGFLLVMYIERFYSSIMYTLKELSLATLAFAGALMVITNAFDIDSQMNITPVAPILNGTNYTNVTSNDSSVAQNLLPGIILQAVDNATEQPKNPIVGFFLAGIAGVLLASIFLLVHTLKHENKTTISYIFTLLVSLFLPIFFPMQGVIKPTLGETGWLLICGVLGELTLLILIRAVQIERTGKVGVLVLTHLVWLYVIRILFGNGLQTGGVVGCALIVVSSIYFCKEGRAIIQARKSFLEDEQKLRNFELRLLH